MIPGYYTEDTLVQQTTTDNPEQNLGWQSVMARCLFLSLGRTKSFNQPINNLQSDGLM